MQKEQYIFIKKNAYYVLSVLKVTSQLLSLSVLSGPEFAWGEVPAAGHQAAAGSAQVEGPAGGDRQ